MLISEIKSHLNQKIIPFWNNLIDDEKGGFYGYVDCDLKLDKNAHKGVILNSRILWFYSNCYLVLKDENCLKYARHAFEFLKNKCYDNEMGGVYWMLDCNGQPYDDMKHTYNQAFAVYALSSYYDATKDKEALDLAYKLYDTIETITVDEYGYKEAFSREWKLIDNDFLSENGLMADKTMNTVLHLIEAYTELYRVDKNENVAKRLRYQLSIMKEKVFDADRNALKVFFDEKMELIGDIHSYGHDIEATWLMDRACEVLGDKALIEEFKAMNLLISQNILDIALENGALNNEREINHIDKKRVWWVQAEGIVGYINAYQNSGEKKYLDTALTLWDYIKNYVIDKREGGEWHAEIEFGGTPMNDFPVVGPWKCPYHNGRMCLEVISRGVDA